MKVPISISFISIVNFHTRVTFIPGPKLTNSLVRSKLNPQKCNKQDKTNVMSVCHRKIINNLRGMRNAKMSQSFIIDGEVVFQRRRIAEGFNNYFVSIAKKLNSGDDLTYEPVPEFSSYMTKRISKFAFYDCSATEVEEIIKEFSNGKASDLPVQGIKICASIGTFSHTLKLF